MTARGSWLCGHPRSAENTANRACRTCKNAQRRERYASDPAHAEAERARGRANYHALEGVAYSWHRLLNRRALALYRRRIRERNQEG